jgi:hypothetical protein
MARAIPKPIPDVDPVMTARFPDKSTLNLLALLYPISFLFRVYAAVTSGWRLDDKKSACKSRRQVIEAGFIQARNLSSSSFFIPLIFVLSKLKV